jgi:hypothetical protein
MYLRQCSGRQDGGSAFVQNIGLFNRHMVQKPTRTSSDSEVKLSLGMLWKHTWDKKLFLFWCVVIVIAGAVVIIVFIFIVVYLTLTTLWYVTVNLILTVSGYKNQPL